MFSGATSFNSDLSRWNVSQGTKFVSFKLATSCFVYFLSKGCIWYVASGPRRVREGAALYPCGEGRGDQGSGLLVPERVRRVGGPDERDAAVPRLCRGGVQDVPAKSARRRVRPSGHVRRRGPLARELAAVPGVQGKSSV